MMSKGIANKNKLLEFTISDSQTSVDLAVPDAALDNHIPFGGYYPKDRIAEDGIITTRYS